MALPESSAGRMDLKFGIVIPSFDGSDEPEVSLGLLYHIRAKRKRTAAGTRCPLRALSHIGEGKGFGYHADLAAQVWNSSYSSSPSLKGFDWSVCSTAVRPSADSPMGVRWTGCRPGAGRPELHGEQMNILLLPFGALHIVDSHGVHPVFPGVPVPHHDLGMSPAGCPAGPR